MENILIVTIKHLIDFFMTRNYEKPLWKKVLDISVILITLPVTLPAAIITAIYIKLVSKGPVLFKQERIGTNHQPFVCYKFRTMKVDNKVDNGHKYYFAKLISQQDLPMKKLDETLKKDDRLIFGAKLLRLTGLDELPQLINVLKNEMSIVGPRPCIRYEYEQFEDWHKERFNVLPGLTGLWQVNGKNKTTFKRMIELDVQYVKQHSFILDLRIIATTFPVLFKQAFSCLNRFIQQPDSKFNLEKIVLTTN